jgi:hypothetical protein
MLPLRKTQNPRTAKAGPHAFALPRMRGQLQGKNQDSIQDSIQDKQTLSNPRNKQNQASPAQPVAEENPAPW